MAILFCSILFSVFIFVVTVFFGLKYRKRVHSDSLLLTSVQIWNLISPKVQKLDYQKADLLFGVWQDRSSTDMFLIVKDVHDLTVATVEFKMASKEKKITIGNQTFTIENMPTWKRSANLKSADNLVLATFKRLSIFKNDLFEIPGQNDVFTCRVPFEQRRLAKLKMAGKNVGMTQNISPSYQIGRIGVISQQFPLPIRIFLLIYG